MGETARVIAKRQQTAMTEGSGRDAEDRGVRVRDLGLMQASYQDGEAPANSSGIVPERRGTGTRCQRLPARALLAARAGRAGPRALALSARHKRASARPPHLWRP